MLQFGCRLAECVQVVRGLAADGHPPFSHRTRSAVRACLDEATRLPLNTVVLKVLFCDAAEGADETAETARLAYLVCKAKVRKFERKLGASR